MAENGAPSYQTTCRLSDDQLSYEKAREYLRELSRHFGYATSIGRTKLSPAEYIIGFPTIAAARIFRNRLQLRHSVAVEIKIADGVTVDEAAITAELREKLVTIGLKAGADVLAELRDGLVKLFK